MWLGSLERRQKGDELSRAGYIVLALLRSDNIQERGYSNTTYVFHIDPLSLCFFYA